MAGRDGPKHYAGDNIMNDTNRRKAVLISKRFQVMQILKFILLYFELMFVCGVVLYILLMNHIGNLKLDKQEIASIREAVLPFIAILFTVTFILSSIVIALFVLYSTHKIAGPLYRFRTALEQMRDGNLNPMMELRANDELKPLSEAMKEFSGALYGDMCRMQEHLKGLDPGSMPGASSRQLEEINAMKSIVTRWSCS